MSEKCIYLLILIFYMTSSLAPGMYFLRVNMEKDAVKTFKIIKK